MHVPVEQFGFIAITLEEEDLKVMKVSESDDITKSIARTYKEFSEAYKPSQGLPDKDFQAFIIRQLLGGEGNHIEDYNQMSEFQQKVIQENKKALKSIQRRNIKDGLTDL